MTRWSKGAVSMMGVGKVEGWPHCWGRYLTGIIGTTHRVSEEQNSQF